MITWTLTEQQADYILNAVAAKPYAETHILIAELMRQANPPKLPVEENPPKLPVGEATELPPDEGRPTRLEP